MSTLPYDSHRLRELAGELIVNVREVAAQGWTPATSSNFSLRLDQTSCAITVSGRDKGQLVAEDVMRVDLDGRAMEAKKPSAETLLHTSLYRREPSIGAILHTHSMMATLLSMSEAGQGRELQLTGLELIKAFAGTDSHAGTLRIPLFDNTQDIAALAAAVGRSMDEHGTGHAYLIRGHGVYTWGADLNEAMRHLEALEFMLEYAWRSRAGADR